MRYIVRTLGDAWGNVLNHHENLETFPLDPETGRYDHELDNRRKKELYNVEVGTGEHLNSYIFDSEQDYLMFMLKWS